jgi:predicted DNA-binding ribbon-helix-helix protein
MENEGDEREQNPEAQLGPLRKHCEADNWEVAGEFVDRESGSSYLRPQFRLMIQRLIQKEADCVYVWKLDRLSRFKALETLILINELKKRDIAIKSIMEPWADTTTANNMSGLLLYITAWLAEQERANISARTKAGIAAKKERCSKCGHTKKQHPNSCGCGVCDCPHFNSSWAGGRPVGSKDTVIRKEKRWESAPILEIADLFPDKVSNPPLSTVKRPL